MTDQSINPSSSDNVLAAISHFFGFLVALVVWAVKKDTSPFVRFQALQAMAFDILVSVIMGLFVGCVLTAGFILLGLGVGDIALFGSQNNPSAELARDVVSALQALPFLLACVISLLGAAIFIIRLVATIQTLRGINFRYPWLGTLVERTLVSSETPKSGPYRSI